MNGRRILVPAVTVAEWGGLHEWVAESSEWLVSAGHEVTVVGRGERFSEAVHHSGADFIAIDDWNAWHLDYARIVEHVDLRPHDMVFTHGPQARALGMAIAEKMSLPLFVMIHGAYHDYAFEWVDRVERIIAASPSLFDYMAGVAKVPSAMIRVVPNGLPEGVSDLRVHSLVEKLRGGVGKIMTASRLDHDKAAQIEVALQVVKECAAVRPDIHWELAIYGDGRMRGYFERELRNGLASTTNSEVKLNGWVDPGEIPGLMSESVVGVVAGLGGMRSIATGTLCVAVGARDNVGVQYGANLVAGLYSNFGDHGAQGYLPSSVLTDLRTILGQPDEYDRVVREVRETMVRLRSTEVVRSALFEALELD